MTVCISNNVNMDYLKIGIVVTFGALFLLGMFLVLRICLCPKLGTSWMRDRDAEGVMRLELTAGAYDDFMHGRLTGNLHREIAHLYALKGDLSAYKQVATRLRHTYLVEFLKDPTRHPMVIHGIIRGKQVGAAAPVQPGAGVGLDPEDLKI